MGHSAADMLPCGHCSTTRMSSSCRRDGRQHDQMGLQLRLDEKYMGPLFTTPDGHRAYGRAANAPTRSI